MTWTKARRMSVSELETDLTQPVMRDVFREDELRPSLPVDAALANAPDRRGDFYGVPAVLD